MAYPPLEDLIAASDVEELTQLPDADAAVLRTAAIGAVEDFCGQVFEASEPDAVMVVRAGRGSELFLPRRVEAITAVDGGIGLDDLTLSADGSILTLADWRYTSNAYERTMRDITGETHTTFGPGLVTLTGTFGWTTCPDAVAAAIRYDMEDTARADANDLAPTVAAARVLGLRTISQGNLNATLGEPSVLTPRAARVLRPYVWYGAGGQVV